MADSKKHHFVPQFILNNFSDEGKAIIHVFDKKTCNLFSSSVINIGHENNFNAVKMNGEKFNFEEIFNDFDSATAPVIKKLISSQDRFDLDHDDLYNLSLFVCTQQFRTKLVRTTIQQFSKDILNWMKAGGNDFKTPFEGVSDEHSKAIALTGFDNIEERMKLLLSKGIVLFQAPQNYPLWISDNPVVMHNEYPYGRPGLGTPGTNIYMPISKNFVLGFFCRIECAKITETYNTKDRLHVPINSDLKNMYDAIHNNKVLIMRKENVYFFNSLQVIYSSRFLYSPTKEFSMAQEMIKAEPKLKEVTTTLGIDHDRKYSGMPMGEVIVFYCENDHFMIPVQLVIEHTSVDLVFYTSKIDKLREFFANGTKISCIEVYKDKTQVRLMREVSITEFDETKGKVAIHHLSEGIYKILMERKSKKQKS